MPADSPKPARYPLLETVLAHKGLQIKGLYSLHDAADIFGVTIRAIQSRIKRGCLISRDLPGRAKFLPVDLEEFLTNSTRKIAVSS